MGGAGSTSDQETNKLIAAQTGSVYERALNLIDKTYHRLKQKTQIKMVEALRIQKNNPRATSREKRKIQ